MCVCVCVCVCVCIGLTRGTQEGEGPTRDRPTGDRPAQRGAPHNKGATHTKGATHAGDTRTYTRAIDSYALVNPTFLRGLGKP